MDALDWLLEDDAPGVAFLARQRLLGESPRSRRMASLRRKANDYPSVARMLERVDDAIAAGNYKKYQGAYWTLIFLAEMQADGRDPRLRKLARHVLSTQLGNAGFSPNGRPSLEIVCLTANLLRALVHCGLGEDGDVVRGYRRLAERILSHGGVPCMIIENHTLLGSCRMTLPQTLRAVAAAPAAVPRREVERLRDVLVGKLCEVRLYRYVRPDARHFKKDLVPLRPQGTTVRELKAAYLRDHPSPLKERLPKESWLRFGFPSSYNPDLLEAMLALAELGVPYAPVMDEALDVIESKRGKDGRLRLETSLNGKMLANVERQGRPSKWVTLRALHVLQRFGRLTL